MNTRRRLIASIATIMFVLSGASPSQTARANTGPQCQGPIAFAGEVAAPPGAAVLRVIRIDPSCRVVTMPDRVLTPDEATAIVAQRLGANQASDPVPARNISRPQRVPGAAQVLTMVPGGPIHMFNRIKDALGLNVTSIDPHNFSYGYNGSTITSTTHDATVNRAVDTDPNQCGHGWDVVWPNTSITISGGGVGSTFADSLTHAEFSYLGRFDCSGTLYYNILDTKLTGFGSGASSTCAYRTQLRNTYFGWYQELLCWDAYVWTTPPPF